MFRIKSTIIAIIFVDSNDEKAGRDGCGKEKKLLFCQEGRSCPFPRGGCRREERDAFACLYADAIHADSRPRRNPAKRSSRSFFITFHGSYLSGSNFDFRCKKPFVVVF